MQGNLIVFANIIFYNIIIIYIYEEFIKIFIFYYRNILCMKNWVLRLIPQPELQWLN